MVKDNWDHANSVSLADMDGDNDQDIIATASFRTAPENGEIAWFENSGNFGFTEHNIINNHGRPSHAVATDIDDDGDMDVIATICQLNRIELFENDGNFNFTTSLVSAGFSRPHCVEVADIDNDGDSDLVGAAIDANQIAWWENNSGSFSKHTITTQFGGATWIDPGDIDMDGDIDILGTAQFDEEISWWENSLTTGLEEIGSQQKSGIWGVKIFPNPVDENSCLEFYLPEKGNLTIEIINSLGARIKSFEFYNQEPGYQKIPINIVNHAGDILQPGVYFIRIDFNKEILVKRLLAK